MTKRDYRHDELGGERMDDVSTNSGSDERREPWRTVLRELRALRDERRRGEDELWDAIDELHALVLEESGSSTEATSEAGKGSGGPSTGDDRDGRADAREGRMDPRLYARLKRRFRRLVDRTVPSDSRVAVAARGDDELLDFHAVEGEHFPQSVEGHYAGFYPADGTGAIAHVEWLCARGVSWLAFPASATWWLDSFPRLARHLRSRAFDVIERDGVGVLFDLRLRPGAEPTADERLAALVQGWEEDGLQPSVLDWGAGPDALAALPEEAVFRPPDEGGRELPYLDDSVDIVAVAESSRLPEARRVARRSVLRVGRRDGRPVAEVEHVGDPPPALPSATVIIPTYDGLRHVGPCVRALRATLPTAFDGEVLVVDDGSGSVTREALEALGDALPWLRVVRNERNLGFLGSCNRGAEEATGRYLVFLNDDTVPLPGWLEALLTTFRTFDDAGAAGGRLVYPDGRLQEAGCVVYRDGSGANLGRGDWKVDAPLYRWVRRVDYCSGALLATPRDLFRSLGGFDPRYEPAYYEDTDYCFRLREAGYSVYYQPRATVVHAEGGTAGVDTDRGVKRHQRLNRAVFRERWSDLLADRPRPPAHHSELVWHQLAFQETPS